jgi:uncharacterized alkaline shock family protein YloU
MTLVLNGPHGTITVHDPVLLQIAARAAESVDGVQVRRRRSLDVDGRLVRLELSATPGEPLVAQGERAQVAVAAALKQACELDVAVDVAFEEWR